MAQGEVRLVHDETTASSGLLSEAGRKPWRLKSSGMTKGRWSNKSTAVSESRRIVKDMPGTNTLVIENKNGGVQERVTYESEDSIGKLEDML